MRKRISALVIAMLFICTMAFSANATSPEVYRDYEVIHTEEGDFEIETTLTVYPALARTDTVTGSKSQRVSKDGTLIGVVTLTATFGYDWVGSWVEDAHGSHTTYDGWSYANEKITTSGSTAKLTAKLTKPLSSNYSASISLRCSADGTIS